VKVLFDTNVVLDLLMDRAPHSDAAAELFAKVEDGSVVGYLCGTTITTVYYLTAKVVGAKKAREEVHKILALFDVAPVNRAVLESALSADFANFEDAVIHEAACHAGAEAIITRNQKDFKRARISVYIPTELARILSVQNKR